MVRSTEIVSALLLTWAATHNPLKRVFSSTDVLIPSARGDTAASEARFRTGHYPDESAPRRVRQNLTVLVPHLLRCDRRGNLYAPLSCLLIPITSRAPSSW